MPPDARTLTAAELLAIRRRLGMSQAGIARALGVGLRTYCRWERGETDIPGPVDPATRALLAEGVAAA